MMPKNTDRLIMTLAVASLGFQVAASATGANAQTVDNLGPIAAATVGTTIPRTPAEGYRTAVTGGPSFGQPGGPPYGSVFALTETAVTITKSGSKDVIAADSTTDADGATVKVLNRATDEIELQVPGLAIDAKLKLIDNSTSSGKSASTKLANGEYLNLKTFDDNLNYAILGQWAVTRTKEGQDTNAGYFMIGFRTPIESMPKQGGAFYNGQNNVNGTVLIQGGVIGQLHGNGDLAADFANDTVDGLLSDIKVTSPTGAVMPWDTITLTGTISGNVIRGTTSVLQSPGNSLSLAPYNSKGTLSGGFYGPTANEVALIWTLHDAKGSTAVGTFGAAAECLCVQAR